jgi:hypothetical protein
MSQYYTLVTDIGLAKLANAASLGQKVAITTVAVGDGGGNPITPASDMTSLVNQVWSGPVTRYEADPNNPTQLIIEGYIPADVGGWVIREVGIFDEDGDLIAVGNYDDTNKPAIGGGLVRDLLLRTVIELGNYAGQVVIEIDPAIVLASRQWVNDNYATRELDNVLDSKVLDKLKNVDGSGSGLDADLLDGQHSVDFGRKVFETTNTEWENNQYTKVARITIASRYSEFRCILNTMAVNHGHDSAQPQIVELSVKQQDDFGENPYVSLKTWSPAYPNYHFGYVVVQNSPTTIVDIYAFISDEHTLVIGFQAACSALGKVHYDWYSNQPVTTAEPSGFLDDANYKLWHTGNDGSGSGLDADLLRGLPADFSSSKASSGYQKLPSGLIIQWGKANVGQVSGGRYAIGDQKTVSVSFPITFPHAALNISATAHSSDDGINDNNGRGSATICSYSGSGATLAVDPHQDNYNANFYIHWIAIGY